MSRAGLIELSLPADECETEAVERLGHERSVVLRIIEARNILIGRISDDQRDPVFGHGRTARN